MRSLYFFKGNHHTFIYKENEIKYQTCNFRKLFFFFSTIVPNVFCGVNFEPFLRKVTTAKREEILALEYMFTR